MKSSVCDKINLKNDSVNYPEAFTCVSIQKKYLSSFLLDEICGSFLEHVTSLEKVCSVPVLNIFPQVW